MGVNRKSCRVPAEFSVPRQSGPRSTARNPESLTQRGNALRPARHLCTVPLPQRGQTSAALLTRRRRSLPVNNFVSISSQCEAAEILRRISDEPLVSSQFLCPDSIEPGCTEDSTFAGFVVGKMADVLGAGGKAEGVCLMRRAGASPKRAILNQNAL